MTSTAEQLAQKNREGLSQLLSLLTKLGVPYREIARKLAVSAPMITYWAQHKLRMSPEDQTRVYGIFAEAVTQRWPEDNEARQKQLLPLMEQLAKTWLEASALADEEQDEALNALMDEYNALQKQQVLDVEGLYRFTTASDRFQAMTQAKYEQKMTIDAWKKADEAIAKAKKLLEADPLPAPRPRPRRPSQRKRRARARA